MIGQKSPEFGLEQESGEAYFSSVLKRTSTIKPIERKFISDNMSDLSKVSKISDMESPDTLKIGLSPSVRFNRRSFSLDKIVRENIQMRYRFEKTLGEGAFGKVKIASLIDNPSKKFAVKSIPRKLIDF